MTTIEGPWDDLDPDKKHRVQSSIKEEVYTNLFLRRFPLRGVQDRVVASLLYWFYQQCNELHVPDNFYITNETIATHILNSLWNHQVSPPPVLTTHR